MVRFIGTRFVWTNGKTYMVRKPSETHTGWFDCYEISCSVNEVPSRIVLTKPLLESNARSIVKPPFWQAGNGDPNTYADLIEVLLFLGVEDIPGKIEELIRQNAFGVGGSDTQYLIQADGIKWFLKNHPNTTEFFFPAA